MNSSPRLSCSIPPLSADSSGLFLPTKRNEDLSDPESVEIAVLDLIARAHRMRPATVARALDVSRKRVEGAINRLIADGLVFTMPNPHDERSNVVCLTATGHARALALHRAKGDE